MPTENTDSKVKMRLLHNWILSFVLHLVVRCSLGQFTPLNPHSPRKSGQYGVEDPTPFKHSNLMPLRWDDGEEDEMEPEMAEPSTTTSTTSSNRVRPPKRKRDKNPWKYTGNPSRSFKVLDAQGIRNLISRGEGLMFPFNISLLISSLKLCGTLETGFKLLGYGLDPSNKKVGIQGCHISF